MPVLTHVSAHIMRQGATTGLDDFRAEKPHCWFSLVLALLVVTFVSVPVVAAATETGQTQYPVGINTLANGHAPPPGVLFMENYWIPYHWSHSLAGSDGSNVVPGFFNGGSVDAYRFMYTFRTPPLLGIFNYTVGVVFPIVHNDIALDGKSWSATALGDIDLQGYLQFHVDNKLFAYFGLDVYAPTGRYDVSNPATIGSNYWSFDPNVNVTYNATRKLTLNASVYFEFPTKNHATDYQSGNTVDLDYAVNFQPWLNRSPSRFSQHLAFGLGGNLLEQFTDDVDDADPSSIGPDGHRTRSFSIGPQIIYHTKAGGFLLKFQRDLYARNTARSSFIWFEFATPLSL